MCSQQPQGEAGANGACALEGLRLGWLCLSRKRLALLCERVERQLRLFLSWSEKGPGKMIILANEPLLSEEKCA